MYTRTPENLALFLLLAILFSCNSPEATTAEADKPQRNMFGHHVPRGLTIKGEELAPGYVLSPVPNSAQFNLIDRNGRVVHQWKGNYEIMGGYLMDDGSLYQTAMDQDFPTFTGGGYQGRIQRISWDSKISWDFEYADERQHVHHDIAVMPNGHVLALAWEVKTAEEALQAGRNPERIPPAGLWSEKVIEIVPQGKFGGEIVWEWRLWDHLVQDFDPGKDNYGDPSEYPGRMDINLENPDWEEPPSQDSLDQIIASGEEYPAFERNATLDNWNSDFLHANAINYHPELDQIVISVRQISEIFIIDHSTTTEEAASNQGGRRGKGGDILYRWGNPANYGRGDSTDRQLFFQHDVRWVEPGKPGAGHLTIFNNDIPGRPDSMNYSAIFEIEPPTDVEGNYLLGPNGTFGPVEPLWKYIAKDTVSFWSSFISGAHRMENGNTFITEGARGRFFEVTPAGEILWEFLNPYRGDILKPNGDPQPLMPLVYWNFRATFISADHPALAGKTLSPLDPQPEVFQLPPKEELQ